MKRVFNPFHFVLIAMAGWMNHRQYQLIDYLREENRVLREQLGGQRVRFNDDQRRRLAVRAKALGQRLRQETPIVTWETLLAWHRKLIAQKYDGSGRRSPGRPRTIAEIEALVVRMAQENRDWGYSRIEGALSNLRHKLGRSTIAAILKTARHRACARTNQEDNLERVSGPALGGAGGGGLLHGGSMDPQRAAALPGAVLYRVIHAQGRDCGHHLRCQWPVDDPGGQKCDGSH